MEKKRRVRNQSKDEEEATKIKNKKAPEPSQTQLLRKMPHTHPLLLNTAFYKGQSIHSFAYIPDVH